jgi:hypothetical protein
MGLFLSNMGALSWTNLVLLASTLLVVAYWLAGRSSGTCSQALDKAPKIGISNVWFASLRAKIHYIKHGFGMIHEAYTQVRFTA